MEAYFVRDRDPQGGHYDVWRAPDMEHLRPTVQEIRKGEFPADVWMGIFLGEIKPNMITHYDDVFLPYFEQAESWWTREGGYVNDSDTV